MKTKITRLSPLVMTAACVGIHASPYNEEDQCWDVSVEVTTELLIFASCDDAKKDGVYWG